MWIESSRNREREKKKKKKKRKDKTIFILKKEKVRRTVRIHRSSIFKSGQNRRFMFYLTFHPSILENEATCADAQHAVVANLKGGRE